VSEIERLGWAWVREFIQDWLDDWNNRLEEA
jgi:hypothetical protein